MTATAVQPTLTLDLPVVRTKAEFRTITGDDWRRSLAMARARRTTAVDRIRSGLANRSSQEAQS